MKVNGFSMATLLEKCARLAYLEFITGPEPSQGGGIECVTTYPTWENLDNENKELWKNVAAAVLKAKAQDVCNHFWVPVVSWLGRHLEECRICGVLRTND